MAKFKAPPPRRTWRDYLRDRRYTLYPLGGLALLGVTGFLIYINLVTGGGYDVGPVARDFAVYLQQLDRYQAEQGRFPTTEEGLAALTTTMSASDSRPYLRELLLTPDGLPYAYSAADTGCRLALRHGGRDLALESGEGVRGEDDIYRRLVQRW